MRHRNKVLMLLVVFMVLVPVYVGSKQSTNVQTVFITKSGDKYHRDSCKFVAKTRIPITLEQALGRGYQACKVCKP